MYIHQYVHIRTHTQQAHNTHTCVRVHKHTYAHSHTHARTHTHTHTHAHVLVNNHYVAWARAGAIDAVLDALRNHPRSGEYQIDVCVCLLIHKCVRVFV